LCISKKSRTFAANFALRMVAIATKFEPNSMLWIYKEGELSEADTVRKIGISDFSTKPTNFYNLDVVISVGYLSSVALLSNSQAKHQ